MRNMTKLTKAQQTALAHAAINPREYAFAIKTFPCPYCSKQTAVKARKLPRLEGVDFFDGRCMSCGRTLLVMQTESTIVIEVKGNR